jgi:hypothetical protein
VALRFLLTVARSAKRLFVRVAYRAELRVRLILKPVIARPQRGHIVVNAGRAAKLGFCFFVNDTVAHAALGHLRAKQFMATHAPGH